LIGIGIILLILFIKRRKKQKNEKKRKNEQQLNENNSMIQQKKEETFVIESVSKTVTSFDETNTNTTTLSTYQPGIHSSQTNKQTNKSTTNTFSLLHTRLIFDTHIL
jgi:cellulose synthase/poly-beta-1,6-N-acetylglucosamine synthase-like glycosyltransferase